MKFTDRYIELPVRVSDVKQEKYGKEDYECDYFEGTVFINPYEIESFSETIPGYLDFDKENSICTNVVTKSGNEYLIFMKIKDFEKLLNEHEFDFPFIDKIMPLGPK